MRQHYEHSNVYDARPVHQHGYSRQSRLYLKATALLVPVAIVLLCIVLLARQADPLYRQQQQDAYYRQQQIDSQLYSIDVLVSAGWKLLPLLLVAGAGAVVLVLVYRRYADVASVKAFYSVKALEAQHQPYQTPHSLTYSPHFSNRQDGMAQLEAPEAPQLPVNVPTFSALLDSGKVGRGQPLLLGIDSAGQHLAGSWLDLYSTAVAGYPGSGKTTSQRFLAAQSALHGAQFVVCDPHYGAADDSLGATLEPLSSVFLCDVASDNKTILEAVRLVRDIGEKRIQGKDKSTTPIILWLDEATRLLGHSTIGDELAELLEDIAQQYRKRAVYASISGQIWTAERSGGSALRDSLASVLCHRMKRSQARLLLPTDDAQQVERLERGTALLYRTSGASSIVSVPNTTASDIKRVAGLLTNNAPVIEMEAPRKHYGNTMETRYAATGSTEPLDASAARILQAFLAGSSIPDIARDVCGTTSGRKYQEASAEVQRILRQSLGGM